MANPGSGSPRAITYERLNEAVNRTYFDGRHASLPVYLDLEQQHQEELARHLGVDSADVDGVLGETVAATLLWGNGNVYAYQCDMLDNWEAQQRATPPPFSALLLTLSVAAERMRADSEFSSNNYYQRLVDVLRIDKGNHVARKEALAHSARFTAVFWESLNAWLTQHDHAYGQPTADDFNSKFRYVSFAVSQSLIRDVDRQRLRLMFAGYGLSRRNKVSSREMRLCLLSWINSANGPTQSLRRMVANGQLVDRLVDAALAELELYDGGSPSAEGASGGQRLFWVIFERGFPRKQMRLRLAAANLSTDLGDLEEIDITAESGVRARRLRLEPSGPADIQCLGPTELLNLERMFYSAVQVRSAQGLVFSHDPSPIIPLKRRDDAPYWQEVSRIEPHTRHVVICHEKWVDRVAKHLAEVAEPGFSAMASGLDHGFLPHEWVAFRDVIVTRLPPREVPHDLQVLVPMSSGKELHCVGGLPLARSIWHSAAPPAIHLDTDDTPRQIVLERSPGKSFEIDPSTYDPGFLSEHAGHPLEGKNLKLLAKGSHWRLTQALSFRSANTPRWLAQDQRASLAYGLGGAAENVLSAAEDTGQPGLQGHVTRGIGTPPAATRGLSRLARINGAFEEEDDPAPRYDQSAVTGVEGTCILRGHHIWVVDEATTRMQCRSCSKFHWVAEYKAAWAQAQRRRQPHHAIRVAPAASDPAAAQQAPVGVGPDFEVPAMGITPDVLVDAACYLGSGSIESLQSLLAHLHRDPIELSSTTRALVDLGIIDTQLDENLARVVRWAIPPPCLVLIPGQRIFLSGFRSSQLLAQLDDALEGFDCTRSRITQANAPAVHFWTAEGLDAREIREIVAEVRDPYSRVVAVEEQVAPRLVAALPPIGAILQSLRPIHIAATEQVERFDVASGRWHADVLEAPGAYRMRLRGLQYFFHDGSTSRATPYELAKLLAARLERRYLHAYEAGGFRCLIGCEPPGLFRRALVACSGLLPARGDGVVIYGGVDEALADSILGKLYG
jgi:hypothetical protein